MIFVWFRFICDYLWNYLWKQVHIRFRLHVLFLYFVACPFMSISCSCLCPCSCLVSCVHVCVCVSCPSVFVLHKHVGVPYPVYPCWCPISVSHVTLSPSMSMSRVPVCVLFFEFCYVPCPFPYPCPMSVSRVPVYVHVPCPRPCCVLFFGFLLCAVSVSRVRVTCPPCLCLVSRVCTCLYPCFINMFVSVFVSVYVSSIRVRVHAWWTWLCSRVNSLRFEDHSILRPTLYPIWPQLIIIPDSVLLQSINNKQSFFWC